MLMLLLLTSSDTPLALGSTPVVLTQAIEELKKLSAGCYQLLLPPLLLFVVETHASLPSTTTETRKLLSDLE